MRTRTALSLANTRLRIRLHVALGALAAERARSARLDEALARAQAEVEVLQREHGFGHVDGRADVRLESRANAWDPASDVVTTTQTGGTAA